MSHARLRAFPTEPRSRLDKFFVFLLPPDGGVGCSTLAPPTPPTAAVAVAEVTVAPTAVGTIAAVAVREAVELDTDGTVAVDARPSRSPSGAMSLAAASKKFARSSSLLLSSTPSSVAALTLLVVPTDSAEDAPKMAAFAAS